MRKSKTKTPTIGIQLARVYPASEENQNKLKQYVQDKYIDQKLNWNRNQNKG